MMSQWDKLISRTVFGTGHTIRGAPQSAGILRLYDVCTPKRQQPYHIPKAGMSAHHDPQAQADQEGLCADGKGNRRKRGEEP